MPTDGRGIRNERGANLVALARSLQDRPAIPGPLPPFHERTYADLHGPGLKNRVRAVIWRVVAPLLGLQRPFNATVVDQLNRLQNAHRESEAHLARFQSLLVQHLQGMDALSEDWLKRWDSLSARDARLVARVAAVEDLRTTTALAQQTALSLKREVERLLAAAPAPQAGAVPPQGAQPAPPVSGPDLDAFKYLGFEDAFRGSPESIRARMAEYAPRFDGQSDVLDIGCGRGEFLELLKQRGVRARGVDANHEMVEVCRANGLDVTEDDALRLLMTLDDSSVGGIFAAQVVEHLQPGYLMRLLETASHKVRPGGILILETINPACWLAFFESFVRDVTHVWPLHPETLQYLTRASGFRDVRIEYRSPVGETTRLHPVPGSPKGAEPTLAELVETFNDNVTKLNTRLFSFQDYAIVARR